MAKDKPIKIKQLPIEKREIIWNTIKVYLESGMSYHNIRNNIEHKYNVLVGVTSISDYKKNNRIEQGKTESLKADIVAVEEDNRKITERKIEITERIVNDLNEFDITIMDEIVSDELKRKSTLFSTANLSLIRKNQMLTKNTKQVIEMETIYSDEGKPLKKTPICIDIELNPNDLKALDDGIDKNAISLELAPRHSNQSVTVNTQNNLTTNEILTIDDIYNESN